MSKSSLAPGSQLTPLTKPPITKLQLLKYAGASGDYNLIHTDVETARAVGLPDVIAHGMLSMGFLGQYAAGIAGPANVRRLSVRFRQMVPLGTVLTCRGVVREVQQAASGRSVAVLEIWAEDQNQQQVTAGEAEIYLEG